MNEEKEKILKWWHRHRLEVMRLVYSGEAEGEDVWGDLGAEEGLRPAPGRYQRSQRTTLPPYMSVAISTSSSAAYNPCFALTL